MVQPATPTPTSTCACIIDPIVNSAPYQLISGPCSAIGHLAQRIMNFVTSIFTVIVNFVKSCFCGAAAATTPPGGTGSTTSPVTTTPNQGPRNPIFSNIGPVGNPAVDTPEGKAFLAHLLTPIANNFDRGQLLALMQNEEQGNAFLANLLVFALVIETGSIENQPLPFMVKRTFPNLTITFESKVVSLRQAFAELDRAQVSSETDDDDDDDSASVSGVSVNSVGPLGQAVRQAFVDRHLTITTAPNANDTAIIPEDVFDDNPDNSDSDANVFYAKLNTLARNFVIANPTFVAAANAFRAEYIQNHANPASH